MQKEVASQLIKSIAEAIKNDPSQFQFTINFSGTTAIWWNGWPWIFAQAIGGWPWSNTIGFQSSLTVDNNTFDILKKSADQQISQQMTELYSKLNEIANKLNTEDKSTIEWLYSSLKKDWVPTVITWLVKTIITMCS